MVCIKFMVKFYYIYGCITFMGDTQDDWELGTRNRTVLTVLTSLLNSPRIRHVTRVECMKLSHGSSFHHVRLLIACV